MLIASWKVRAALPVALLLAWAAAPAHAQNKPPVIMSISAAQVAGQKFRFTGTVGDDTPGSCSVTMTGAAQGSAPCDSAGNFDVTLDVPALGTVTVVASDGNASSNSVDLGLTNAAPATNCRAIIRGSTLTISGMVADEAPGGLTITLSGSAAVNGLRTTVLANGVWTTTATILPGGHGTVTATVTDWYGLTGSATTTY